MAYYIDDKDPYAEKCTGCGKGPGRHGFEYPHNEPWHKHCYEAWQAEYATYLDSLPETDLDTGPPDDLSQPFFEEQQTWEPTGLAYDSPANSSPNWNDFESDGNEH